MPLLMRVYPGLKPWDLDRLTADELVGLVGHARAVIEAEGANGS